jgi:hypothetical protein
LLGKLNDAVGHHQRVSIAAMLRRSLASAASNAAMTFAESAPRKEGTC